MRCFKCRKEIEEKRSYYIDNMSICALCLYGIDYYIKIFPIGYVKNNTKNSADCFYNMDQISEIHLNEECKKFTTGLSEESELIIVWSFHKKRRIDIETNRRLDGKLTGPFACRTPNRPNFLAVSEVKLIEYRDGILKVRGLDAIDGSPVIDIKPIFRGSDDE